MKQPPAPMPNVKLILSAALISTRQAIRDLQRQERAIIDAIHQRPTKVTDLRLYPLRLCQAMNNGDLAYVAITGSLPDQVC